MNSLRSLRWRRAVLTFVAATLCALCLAVSVPAQVKATNTRAMQDYAGTWVAKFDGKNFLILTLKLVNGRLAGSLAAPERFEMGQGGEIRHISSTHLEKPILEASLVEGDLRVTAGTAGDPDEYVLRLSDSEHAVIQIRIGSSFAPDPTFELLRVSDSENPTIAVNWDISNYPQEIVALQSELDEMVKEDQGVRMGGLILESKIKEVDEKNYPELLRIYEKYKWPPFSVVGRAAAHNFWLLVQHQNPDFQRRVLPDLQRAVEAGEASKVDYAYLYDRVMIGEGKPQHWGTQTNCENGKAVLAPVDDPAGLEQRRKDLQMIPAAVDEYLKLLDPQCFASSNDTPAQSNPQP
jgi:hypothetical protein